MSKIKRPFFPIIYVRGYAGNEDEVEDTVSDPYMGFNLGATKLRQLWTGKVERHYFESPLVRLMKDHNYRDVYSAGLEMAPEAPIEPQSVIRTILLVLAGIGLFVVLVLCLPTLVQRRESA